MGSIRPEREIAVKSKISGIVKRSYREVGDRVRAGDPLFEILPDPTPMELTEARREVEIAQNIYEQAKKKSDRSQGPEGPGDPREPGLGGRRQGDPGRPDPAEPGHRAARPRREGAREDRSAWTWSRSSGRPSTGTVLELLVHEGDPVVPLTSYQAGTALTTLADMSTLLFKGTVDEIDVGKLKEGMPARIKVGALPDAKVDGKVYKISPKSKTAEGATLFDVEIALLPAPGVVLRAGYSANADVVVREKQDVLLIPERLVTFADGKSHGRDPGRRRRGAREARDQGRPLRRHQRRGRRRPEGEGAGRRAASQEDRVAPERHS